MNHTGDPCIHCGLAHDDVAPGPCPKTEGLAATTREIIHLTELLKGHKEAAESETKRLECAIASRRTIMSQAEAGLDLEKIALAETVLYVHGDFAKAGEGRMSARADAITWLATGKPLRNGYGDLRREFFGTKDYDRWHGQREDHEYGFGPRHGSTIFCIGLFKDARNRDLTGAECEAAIYYLTNLERVQAARVAA